MKVFLVMCGANPQGVFWIEEKAQDFISERSAFTGLPLDHYTVHVFYVR